jgi:RHS repeat-associated protein
VQGDSARYVDVVPGVDLLVTAMNVGFEFSVVFTARPAGALVLPFGVRAAVGVEARLLADGAQEWSRDGETVAVAAPAVMWDSRTLADGSPRVISEAPSELLAAGQYVPEGLGLPTAAVPFVQRVSPSGSAAGQRAGFSTRAGKGLPGSRAETADVLSTLPSNARGWVFAPPAEFLADPATVFPVTVDPVVASAPVFDTYVRNGTTADLSSATTMQFGNTSSGLARAFLTFDSVGIDSTYVNSANLSLYETYSPTCTAKSWTVWHTGSPGPATRWTNQPTWYSDWAVSTQTRGSSGCVGGRINADVTSLLRSIAASGQSRVALGIRATDESDAQAAKTVYSAEGPYLPSLTVNYDHYPFAPKRSSVSPGTSVSGVRYVGSLTPSVSPVVSDADGGMVRARVQVWNAAATTKLWDGYSGYVISGERVPGVQIPSGILSNGSSYKFKVWSNDGTVDSKDPKATDVTVDTTAPAISSFFCSGLTLNGFTTTAPTSNVSCSATVSSGASGLRGASVNLDGSLLAATVSGSTVSFAIPGGQASNMWHRIEVAATSSAGTPGTETVAGFGFGSATIESQSPNGSTSSSLPIKVHASSGAGVVVQYWSPTTSSWVAIANAALSTTSGGAVTQPVVLAVDGSALSSATYLWDLTASLDWDTIAQVRACIQQVTGANCSGTTNVAFTAAEAVTLDRSGAAAPTTGVGPVSVSLLTGAAMLFGQGATLSSWAGATSVGLSYQSYRAGVDSIFGKGWTAMLPSANWTRVADASAHVLVYDSVGIPWGFTKSGSTFVPDDASSSMQLTFTAGTSSTAATFTLTELDGTTSIFAYPNVGTAPSGSVSVPISYPLVTTTNTLVAGSTSTFVNDSAGHVTRIIAPLPTGISASSCASSSMTGWVPGCADLMLLYDASGHVTKITQRGYSQGLGGAGAAQTQFSTDVACYAYDSSGYLTATWDAREQSTGTGTCSSANRALSTTYVYNTSGRLSSVTPAGLQPWTLSYDTSGRVSSVSRAHVGGSPIATTIGYDINVGPASSTSDETHPDLSATAITAWAPNGTLPPVTATAVWAPGGSTSDLRDAGITALDAQGRSVFTASFSGTGQAGWHIATAHFDTNGNLDWTLSAGNRDIAMDASNYATAWSQLGWVDASGNPRVTSAFAADALATKSVYADLASDGIWDLTDIFGPTHLITIEDSTAPGRTHTHTTYGTATGSAPTNSTVLTTAPTHAPITTTVAATGGESITGTDLSGSMTSTLTRAYALSDGASGYLTAGWNLRQPMQVKTDLGAGTGIVTETLINSVGQVIEQRQPSTSGTSGTAASTVTVYYTTGNNPNACQSTIWFGQVCKVGPASGSDASTLQTSYDSYLRPVTVTDSMGGSTRTTTRTYRNSGQSSLIASIAISGGVGTSVPTTTFGYDLSTGLVTSISNGSVTMTRSFDDFGQVVASSDGAGGSTTSTFDSAGRAASLSATQGTTTVYAASYAYNQGSEHRGLPTSITYSGLPAAITATYDGDGALVTQTLPQVSGGGGTITQAWARDPAGNTTAMEYTQAGLPFRVSDTVEVDPAGRWAGESQSAGSWTRDYSYDPAGRLVGVTHDDGVSCVTHTYGFDVNSNRTATGVYPDAGGATPTDTCQSSTGTVTSSTFSTADRPTTLNGVNVASTYDAFGRTTSLAAALAPSGTAVSSIGYYVNDLVRTMTSAGVNKTWTLDGAGRLACQRSKPTTTTDSSACGATTTASVVDTVNHYLDASSDSPAWTLTNTAGTPSTIAYLTGLDGTLIAQISGSTIDYQLASIHGDIVATCSTTAAGSYDGATITADEYGNTDVAARYAWLGGKQRPQDGSAGLILMGVRLYNTVTGLFLTPDPIRGGNDNSYGYPTEPITNVDSSGLCARATWTCVLAILTSDEPFPPGFMAFLAARGESVRRLNVKGGIRWGVVGSDHCSGGPSSGPGFDFTNACDTHDLGYDLLRRFKIGGIARLMVDELFKRDVSLSCFNSWTVFFSPCLGLANLYAGVVRAASIFNRYMMP